MATQADLKPDTSETGTNTSVDFLKELETEIRQELRSVEKNRLFVPMDSSGGSQMPSEEDIAKHAKPLQTTKLKPSKIGFDEESLKKLEEDKMRRSPKNRDYKAEYFAKRDPMQEFFQLTCKSIILSSPHMNTICTVDTNQLYKKALKANVPFFKWASWIEDFLNKEFMK